LARRLDMPDLCGAVGDGGDAGGGTFRRESNVVRDSAI
jgi:hypothetical protein